MVKAYLLDRAILKFEVRIMLRIVSKANGYFTTWGFKIASVNCNGFNCVDIAVNSV